jgi:hypothetical protein
MNTSEVVMEIKITEKVLSLPPYLSTSWKNIAAVRVENRPFGHLFLIELLSGTKVEIPNLEPNLIEAVFTTHARVLEQESHLPKGGALQTLSFPIPLDGIATALQHNPDQADTPPLPPEVLNRLKSLKETLSPDLSHFPKSEPHCNCPYCQIFRTLSQEESAVAPVEEPVSDEDLKFRTWDIKVVDEKLYSVSNALDPKEHYNVFLGKPVGCTCGKDKCVHIDAVLRS